MKALVYAILTFLGLLFVILRWPRPDTAASTGTATATPVVAFQTSLPIVNGFSPPSATSTAPVPTGTAVASPSWSQDAANAQRTGAVASEPSDPWTLAWTFNGPDGNGGLGNHLYDAPVEGRVVAGAGNVYAPAGVAGLYALSEQNGAIVWHDTSTSYNASPAFDPTTGEVLAGGTDGRLHAFNGQTGSPVGSFNAGSPVNKSVLLVGPYAYIVTDDGHLDKVSIATLTSVWSYAGGAVPGTSAAYSTSRDAIVYCTNQTSGSTCHAVNNSNGSEKWSVRPSTLTPIADGTTGFTYNQFNYGWPVIAEAHGIVMLIFDLGDINETLTSQHPPSSGNYFPPGPVNGPTGTNALDRTWLLANPQYQSLFALSLDTGASAFVPAAGYWGSEGRLSNGDFAHTFNGMPVVRTWPNGDEVAYWHFRNGTCVPPGGDYRWDGQTGEMELDSTTVPGLLAGDFRFVGWNSLCNFGNKDTTYSYIIDELAPFTMAGSSLFYAHWGAQDAALITNRGASLGLSTAAPITVTTHHAVMRSTQPCGTFSAPTHFTSSTSFCALFGDTRNWNTPLFYTYWNTAVPSATGNGHGSQVGYTIVSDGLVITEGDGGDLTVFHYSATPNP